MRVFLRDVHHYLYDTEFSPRAGESYRLRRDVRARAVDVLQAGARRPGPHMVVGHSLGSVIAYDLLTAVEETPRVDALLTVGSPLGMSEVQERLAPPWTRQDGWPSDPARQGAVGQHLRPARSRVWRARPPHRRGLPLQPGDADH
jgi:alpha-beta hydrolase superfamily lysophospholipase